jgi:hypothetical protein
MSAGWTGTSMTTDNLSPFRIFDFEHNEPIPDQPTTVERFGHQKQIRRGFRRDDVRLGTPHHSPTRSLRLVRRHSCPKTADLTQAMSTRRPLGTGCTSHGQVLNPSLKPINPTTGGIATSFPLADLLQLSFTHTGLIGTCITKVAPPSAFPGDNQSTEDNNDAISLAA